MTHKTDPTDTLSAHLEGAFAAPKIIYFLYMLGLFFPLGALGGVVFAYIARGNDADADTHLDVLIQTFWLGVLAIAVGAVLSVVLVGWIIILAWYVWVLARCITGLQLALNGAPVTEAAPLSFVVK